MRKKLALLTICLLMLLITACGGGSGSGSKSNFPTKSIEVVAAGSPGGGLDMIARAIDQAMTDANLHDQPMIITNMGGGGGNEAKAYINKQKDPHYLYTESNRIYVNKIVGTTDLGIDSVTPIARMITEYLVWVVRNDSPYQSAIEILEKLKEDPASIEFGVGTIPSNDQMNILRPAMAYGIDATKVRVIAFQSGGDLMSQLLGGHIPVISTGVSEAIEQVKAGNARILAISAPEPLGGDLEGVPTWKSLGIDVSILHWRGVFAPPNLSQDVIDYWDNKFSTLVKSDAWKATLEKYGWYDAYAGSAEFKQALEEEAKIYEELLTDLGLAKK